ncbi:pirin family protein [Methanosarcina sp. DH2]|jgi:redox-sensitive bicupin YhaK (pirin superfamily)|uniref:pirin family protein n=1 Tax=Methanosarcina sp. DH2 TaxID=2605639 RepID=UPI001E4C7DE2|nr:pirin family protein [Methanosarcina sp. DH2]MCC4771420.1 pirin family protein [Methanosarcina sp. DH2]
MANLRRIRKVRKSMPTVEGAGVHLKRAFGFQHVPEFDPFLLFDEFHSEKPEEYSMGFPFHPHRGIETITYVLQGEVRHEDSLGNRGIIRPGEVQWMTAGSGIIHQEMPQGDENGALWGFQLWANLPASQKMMEPRYQEIKSNRVPELLMEKGLKVRIICGEVNGVEGPVREIITDPEYLDVTVPADENFSHITVPGYTVFAYVIEGSGRFDKEKDPCAFEVEGGRYLDPAEGCVIGPETLVLYGDGDSIEVTAGDKGIRFLLISGKPIAEPVAWYGPVVMNTKEELKVAFEEYRQGSFTR